MSDQLWFVTPQAAALDRDLEQRTCLFGCLLPLAVVAAVVWGAFVFGGDPARAVPRPVPEWCVRFYLPDGSVREYRAKTKPRAWSGRVEFTDTAGIDRTLVGSFEVFEVPKPQPQTQP